MTTIACNRVEMAGDGLCITGEGHILSKYYRKVHRMKELDRDILVGCTGKIDQITAFVNVLRQYLDKGSELKYLFEDKLAEELELEENFIALVLTQDGIFFIYDTLTLVPVHASCMAIGGGENYAMFAMLENGWSPGTAIAAASEYNVGTGGQIIVEKL